MCKEPRREWSLPQYEDEVTVIMGERNRTARVRSLSSIFLVIFENGGILELKLHSRS